MRASRCISIVAAPYSFCLLFTLGQQDRASRVCLQFLGRAASMTINGKNFGSSQGSSTFKFIGTAGTPACVPGLSSSEKFQQRGPRVSRLDRRSDVLSFQIVEDTEHWV